VYSWLAEHKEFLPLYVRAREDQADTLVDEILEIADDSALDPNERCVRIDARKWIASKLKPKTYGDKVQTDVSGTISLEQLVLASMKPEDEGK
jgi:hypothetical protein